MKIPSLKLQNFLGIGEAEVALDDRGLVLIQGDNKDDASQNSNGSGKSSILDGLLWVLFNETSRGLSGDDVIHWEAGKECIGEVTIIDGSDEIRIVRWRKAKGFHKRNGVAVFVNDNDETKGTDTLTQAFIETLIGSNKEVFKAAIYSGQEDMVDIPMMTDRQLKSLIENAAGIDTIESAYTIARDRANQADKQAENCRLQLERYEEAVEGAQRELSIAESDVLNWEERRTERANVHRDKARAFAKDAKAKAAEIKTADAEKVELQKQIDTAEAEIAEREERMAEIDTELSKLSVFQKTVTVAEKAFNDANTKRASAYSNAQVAIDMYNGAVSKVKDAENRVGDPCEECGKPLEESDLAKVIELAKERAEAYKTKAKELKAKFEDAKALSDSLEAELESAKAKVPDTSALTSEQRTLRGQIGDAHSRVRKLAQRVSEIEALSDALEDLKRSAVNSKERYDEIMAEENPHIAIVERRETEVINAKRAAVEAADIYDTAAKHLLLCKKTAEVFGPKGVRAHILDTVTPYLNDRTAHYVGTLSDGNIEAVWSTLTEDSKGELKEKFSIIVNKYGRGTFQGLSGGEKRKVRLATMLALQDLVASRATKPIGLWVGDEIDEALDHSGLERLMGLLEMKARDRGTVLIVSHNDLKDWVRDTVTVTMEDKVASVEGVLCV